MSELALMPVRSGESALKWRCFHPFQLVSLLDVLDKYAYGFYNVGKSIEEVRHQCRIYGEFGEVRFSDETIVNVRDLLETAKSWCRDLPNTTKGIDRIIELPDYEFYGRHIALLLGELRRRLDDEIAVLMFLYLPDDKAGYYNVKDLFKIKTKFPQAAEEAMLAGNCFATGNPTACVFHLMRVVEIGAKALVRALKAHQHLQVPALVNGKRVMVKKPVELCDWNTIKQALQKALLDMEKGVKTSVKKKDRLEYFSHAVSQFGLFKDAWRNKVAHSRKVYQPGETLDIMNNVRHFMQHLAQRVKE